MGHVDQAFDNLKRTLEITRREADAAKRHHHDVREYIETVWDVSRTFLTGSYDRHTKTKPLRDVDIFCVLDPDGAQGHFHEREPMEVLAELRVVLRDRWDGLVSGDEMTCCVTFGEGDDAISFEVVPSFDRAGGDYEIPNALTGTWISTNPEKHQKLTAAKNARCDEKWIPLVKMLKGINRHVDDPVKPSFLIEVMALTLVKEPVGRYQDEVHWFLASAAEQVQRSWPDPAGVGPDVNSTLSSIEKQVAASALDDALKIAGEAIRLEDDGQERAAVEEWRRLFGWRMPRP